MMKGLMRQMVVDRRLIRGGIGSVVPGEEEEVWEKYYDDLSGEELDPVLIKEARKEEMREFEKHGVYKKVPIQ